MLTEQEKFLFLHYYFSSSKIIIKDLNEYNFFCSEPKLSSPLVTDWKAPQSLFCNFSRSR
jgi:hypothetical protein